MSAIHIILHGLIALVPVTDASSRANHMTALLVDATTRPPEFTECWAPHQPSVVVKTLSTQACLTAGCALPGLNSGLEPDDCVCPLIRKEVSLQAGLSPAKANIKHLLKNQPGESIPFDLSEASDFSYVANISRLGYALDRRYVDDPVPPGALIARMTFPFESLSACSLGTRRDEGSENVHPLSFRKMHDLEKANEVSQALAQQVVVTYETDQNPVALTIKDFGDLSSNRGTTLTLKPINGEYRIQLVNMRTAEGAFNDLAPDDPCDDGVERDFAFFYGLVTNPPAWSDRPIPHVKFTRWKSAKDLESAQCTGHKDHFPNSHPICGLASFTSRQ